MNCLPYISTPVWCDLVAGFTAAYDKSSNKLFERHLHAECRSFLYPPQGYDSSDRLLEVQRGLLNNGGTDIAQHLSVTGLDSSQKYNLDLVGNWVTDDDGTPAFSYTQGCGPEQYEDRTKNALNQVATIQDPSDEDPVPLSYDNAGNLLDDGTLTYAYDALNRLKLVYKNNGETLIAAYSYDAQNRRVQKAVSAGGLTGDIPNGTTVYGYDDDQCVEEYNGSSTLLRQYVWGQYVDELIQQREYTSPPPGRAYVDYYPVSDLLWRVELKWTRAVNHDI